MRISTNFSNGLYEEEKNLFIYCTAALDGLELLSAEHLLFTELLSAENLLFTYYPRQYLALASCSKSSPVSAQRALTLEPKVQYKCRLSVEFSISVCGILQN